ncbi:hypothetical protein Y1Q_0019334 [Alligator mississippiensis]|uniref:Uncharacterized protein n=1 Tax=Alligator mississippiensis TaxID=8496 RepID=A0A151MR81_ALLMI|nr:hypothetical protein Y1Q_0019334 [Alligator mississippiensis]
MTVATEMRNAYRSSFLCDIITSRHRSPSLFPRRGLSLGDVTAAGSREPVDQCEGAAENFEFRESSQLSRGVSSRPAERPEPGPFSLKRCGASLKTRPWLGKKA